MLYGRYSGVVLVGITDKESRALLPYLGWTRLMFEKFGRLGGPTDQSRIPQPRTPDQQTLGQLNSIETGVRAYVSKAGWSGGDSNMLAVLQSSSPYIRINSWYITPEDRMTFIGFSQEFVLSLAKFAHILNPTVLTRLCRTLDRRMPGRVLTGPPTPEGVRLFLQLFEVLSPTFDWSRAVNPETIRSHASSIIQALRVTEDLKLAIEGINRWVKILSTSRHLSVDFVTKHLDTRNICG